MVVDDMPANLQVMAGELEREGYAVVVAQGGEEALGRAALVRPDLILLDVMMPGIDGFETCRRLKTDEAMRDIPVIFMTALSDTPQKLAGFQAGAVDYVTKPLDGAEVLARVRTQIALSAMRRQLAERNAQLAQEVAVREQAQAALQRSNAELEQLAYVASHDMQEPLRMIASYLQLVEQRYQDKLDADGREFIGYAVDGAKRMQVLINDLLTYSRVGTKARPFAPVALHTVVDTALGHLRLAIEESGARIEVGTLPQVNGDVPSCCRTSCSTASSSAGQRRRTSTSPPLAKAGTGTSPCATTASASILATSSASSWSFSACTAAASLRHRHRLAPCKRIVERHGGIWPESCRGRGRSSTSPCRASTAGG
jgi:DNA-binding response OmpR family regulator